MAPLLMVLERAETAAEKLSSALQAERSHHLQASMIHSHKMEAYRKLLNAKVNPTPVCPLTIPPCNSDK